MTETPASQLNPRAAPFFMQTPAVLQPSAMALDQSKVRLTAERLARSLAAHSPQSPDAARLQYGLEELLVSAQTGRLTAPIESNHIPGGRMFSETELGGFRDLEQAYTEFCIAVSGHADQYAQLAAIIHDIRSKPPP